MLSFPAPFATVDDIVARIYGAQRPDEEVLYLMLLLEASGEGVYADLAARCTNPAAAALFSKSGREELGHAHRMRKAIRLQYCREVDVPKLAENPCYSADRYGEVTSSLLKELAASERRGAQLYLRWAESATDAALASLFALSAREELGHAARLEAVAGMLADGPAVDSPRTLTLVPDELTRPSNTLTNDTVESPQSEGRVSRSALRQLQTPLPPTSPSP